MTGFKTLNRSGFEALVVKREERPMKFWVVCALGFFTLWPGLFSNPSLQAQTPNLEPLGIHAHRYQDFQKNAVVCEVFGEVKNTGSRPIKSFTLHLEMLDQKGKTVGEEELNLSLRVIVPRNARGELRAVRPQEIGNFVQDTHNCPEAWLEGRIHYRIKGVQFE